jgi:RNA polymerase sigma-70 factor (ECF subfamily)
LINTETIQRLKDAVCFLTAEQKDLVRRVFFNGEKITDIADKLGVDKSAISHRLERILAKLKKSLQ